MKGVYGIPDDNYTFSDTAAIYLPGIILGTTAVHRLSFQVAEQLSKEGIATLICDHTRVGESEGEFPPMAHTDLVKKIRAGIFVDDTLDMIDWLITTRSIKNILLIGHCGGAVTALLSASKHRAICGIYLISTPITPSHEIAGDITSQSAEEYYSLYKRKFFSLDAWKKLLSGRSSYKTILLIIKKKLFASRTKIIKSNDLSEIVDEYVIEAFRNIPDNLCITMVMGEKDSNIEIFREFISLKPKHLSIKTVIFEKASHGFVSDENLEVLMKSVRDYTKSLRKINF